MSELGRRLARAAEAVAGSAQGGRLSPPYPPHPVSAVTSVFIPPRLSLGVPSCPEPPGAARGRLTLTLTLTPTLTLTLTLTLTFTLTLTLT